MKTPALFTTLYGAVKKDSPKYLTISSIGFFVGGTILSVIASRKLQPVLDRKNQDLAKINEGLNSEDPAESLSVKEARIAKADVYKEFTIDLAKLYLPTVAMVIAGAGCSIGSYNINMSRISTLSASAATAIGVLNTYRGRVREKYGDDVDAMFYHNFTQEKVTEVEVDEDGKEHKVKKTVTVSDGKLNGMFTYAFNAETSSYFENDDVVNRSIINATNNTIGNWWEYHARKDGRQFLFLNDVFKMLGMEITKVGAQFGWWFDPEEHSESVPQIFVYEVKVPCDSYVNGYKSELILEFNCDGYILDKM